MSTKFPATSVKSAKLINADGKAVNCRVADGKLVPTQAFNQYNTSVVKAIRAFHVPSSNFWYVWNGSTLWLTTDLVKYINVLTTFTPPSFIPEWTEEYKFKVATTSYYLTYKNSTHTRYTYPGRLKSLVVKNGRVFGADYDDYYKINWSGPGGITDWTSGIDGSGYVRINTHLGTVQRVFLIDDDIVAICQYGIVKLTAHGTPENFKVTYVRELVPLVYEETAAELNGKLIFCTVDGMYEFDGTRIERVNSRLMKDVTLPVTAAAYGERYYMSCTHAGVACTLVYEPSTGVEYLLDIAPTAFLCAQKLYAFCSDGVYLYGNDKRFSYECETDFGTGAKKTLKGLFVSSDNPLDLTISNGVKTRILRGVSGKVRLYMRGERFTVKAEGDGKVTDITAYAEAIDGV